MTNKCTITSDNVLSTYSEVQLKLSTSKGWETTLITRNPLNITRCSPFTRVQQLCFCPVFKIPSVQFLSRLFAELFLPERRLSFTLEKQSSFFTPYSLFLSMGNRSLTGGISPRHLLSAPFCRGDSQSPHALWPLFWWSHWILLFEKSRALTCIQKHHQCTWHPSIRLQGGTGWWELRGGSGVLRVVFVIFVKEGPVHLFHLWMLGIGGRWSWKLIIYLGHSRCLPWHGLCRQIIYGMLVLFWRYHLQDRLAVSLLMCYGLN